MGSNTDFLCENLFAKRIFPNFVTEKSSTGSFHPTREKMVRR